MSETFFKGSAVVYFLKGLGRQNTDLENENLHFLSTNQAISEGLLEGKDKEGKKAKFRKAVVVLNTIPHLMKAKQSQNVPREKRDLSLLNVVEVFLNENESGDFHTQNQITSQNFGMMSEPHRLPFEHNTSNASNSFKMLEMGDKWLQNSDSLGNLTLLQLLADKIVKNANFKRNSKQIKETSDVEYQLITSQIVNDFVEKFLEALEKLDINDFTINQVIENIIDIPRVSRLVEKAIRGLKIEEVREILSEHVLMKSLKVIKKSTVDETIIDSLNHLVDEELGRIGEKLEKFAEMR